MFYLSSFALSLSRYVVSIRCSVNDYGLNEQIHKSKWMTEPLLVPLNKKKNVCCPCIPLFLKEVTSTLIKANHPCSSWRIFKVEELFKEYSKCILFIEYNMFSINIQYSVLEVVDVPGPLSFRKSCFFVWNCVEFLTSINLYFKPSEDYSIYYLINANIPFS